MVRRRARAADALSKPAKRQPGVRYHDRGVAFASARVYVRVSPGGPVDRGEDGVCGPRISRLVSRAQTSQCSYPEVGRAVVQLKRTRTHLREDGHGTSSRRCDRAGYKIEYGLRRRSMTMLSPNRESDSRIDPVHQPMVLAKRGGMNLAVTLVPFRILPIYQVAYQRDLLESATDRSKGLYFAFGFVEALCFEKDAECTVDPVRLLSQ